MSILQNILSFFTVLYFIFFCAITIRSYLGYSSLAATALKLLEFGGPVISRNIRIVRLIVKTAIIFQWKCLCVPDYTNTESMLINFIQISLYTISLMQAIVYQSKICKRCVAAWKRLGCLQRMQRNWWKIVATPYTQFRVLLVLYMVPSVKVWTSCHNQHIVRFKYT